MRRLLAGDIVLKALGLLLLTAAVLKGHELLTVPMANRDLWSWRPFLIFQVEFELALGIWLLSGVFKRLAWLAALTCFGLFCCVTLYKGITGAASCGCFGRIHVNPWITLIAIDFPAVIALTLFRPVHSLGPLLSFLRSLFSTVIGGQESISDVVRDFLKPLAMSFRLVVTAGFTVAVLGTTTPILAFNRPAAVTSTYEILEPETWVDKEPPIIGHIDIGDRLRSGEWLIVLYHHDCPGCAQAIPIYERMARDLKGNEEFPRVALIEVPPYGRGPVSNDSPCVVGKMDELKEWFVTTPAVMLLVGGRTKAAWEGRDSHTEAEIWDVLASIGKLGS